MTSSFFRRGGGGKNHWEIDDYGVKPDHIYNPIMAMGFSAMCTFQLEVTIAGTPLPLLELQIHLGHDDIGTEGVKISLKMMTSFMDGPLALTQPMMAYYRT